MKKIYTIGRDEGCDIIIPDSTDVISRLHATIRVEQNGKLYLTDQSRNGTYVNGMKMSSNVEIPVSRKDVVSLAHIYDLDWSLIPKQRNMAKILIVAILSIALLAGVTAYFILGAKDDAPAAPEEPSWPTPHPTTVIERDTVVVRDTVSVGSEGQESVNETPDDEAGQENDGVEGKTDDSENEEIYNPIY